MKPKLFIKFSSIFIWKIKYKYISIYIIYKNIQWLIDNLKWEPYGLKRFQKNTKAQKSEFQIFIPMKEGSVIGDGHPYFPCLLLLVDRAKVWRNFESSAGSSKGSGT